jgi:hypothetical protein
MSEPISLLQAYEIVKNADTFKSKPRSPEEEAAWREYFRTVNAAFSSSPPDLESQWQSALTRRMELFGSCPQSHEAKPPSLFFRCLLRLRQWLGSSK